MFRFTFKSFKGEYKLFDLLFENEIEKHTQDYLLKVEIKDYNVMVNGKKLIDQLQKNDLRTYENI